MADGNVGTVAMQEAPISLRATASLVGKQSYFMKITAGEFVIASSQGEQVIGPLLNDPAAGQSADVESRKGVITQVFVGTNGVTAGNEVTTDANGAAEDASSGDWVAGQAIDTGVSGDYVRMLTLSTYLKA